MDSHSCRQKELKENKKGQKTVKVKLKEKVLNKTVCSFFYGKTSFHLFPQVVYILAAYLGLKYKAFEKNPYTHPVCLSSSCILLKSCKVQ